MNRSFLCMALTLMSCFMAPSFLSAQVVDSTVCEILANPQSFDGKMVRIKGTVIAGFEEFAITGWGCNQTINSIWLAYPEGAKGKAGPAAFLRLQLGKNHPAAVANFSRTPVTLDDNKDFKDFDNLLSTPAKTNGLCLGCVKFTVTATLVGRLDGTKDTGLIRDGAGNVIGIGGFGQLNRYSARLVLQSVSDISSQEIDYANGASVASNDAISGSLAFTPGASAADQVKRGADAWAPGEYNGVTSTLAERMKFQRTTRGKSNVKSPDGLIFQVIFDGDRLKGPAMDIALAHVGTHIADIRGAQSGIPKLPFYGAELRAWQTAVLSAATAKIKSLTLPGGYLIYSRSWSSSELGKSANGSIAEFL